MSNSEMDAVEIANGPEGFVLRPARRPRPRPGAGEVLIAVRAAGVNGHDVHQLHRGGHQIAPGETDLPGLEVAGVVYEVGEGVAEWSVGDEVCALLRGGGYSHYAVAPAGNVLPKPDNLSWAEAAVLPETFFTVWSNVFIDCALAEGETLLMNGGTSGIGVAAIQIASTLGHRVFATARGSEKTAICERLGADRGIDYETENFAVVVQELTGGQGVDVIFDIVAGDYLGLNLDAAAHGARVAFIGGARGFDTRIDIRKLMHKRMRIGGSLLRPRPDTFKRQVRDQLLARVWPHVLTGRIDPVLDRSFPLADAGDAIDTLERREHVGKLALIVDGS